MKRRGNNGQIPSETASFAMAISRLRALAPSSSKKKVKYGNEYQSSLKPLLPFVSLFSYLFT
ncbi:hypothetical protein [Peribacillus sp. TH24]|uniref:hypothetical protein n=1 Tax=Peribacillus sp. TH24 TaxID=2798483 RepID=UPI0019143555|nr:hypothetical protein [Peribacillus sp. TH24]MBK5442721.1 hypothetical protein [Peribacillus sp. TH24]